MKIHITDPNNLWGVQESFVRFGDACGNYYQYTNDYFQEIDPAILNEALDTWAEFSIPIAGNDTWIRTQVGDPDITRMNYVEFNIDVWEYGYQAWIDGVSVPAIAVSIEAVKEVGKSELSLFPNPANDELNVALRSGPDAFRWSIYSTNGHQINAGEISSSNQDYHQFTIPTQDLTPGIYFFEVKTKSTTLQKKFSVVH